MNQMERSWAKLYSSVNVDNQILYEYVLKVDVMDRT